MYFAPELVVYVENGNLFINYAHGRYGFWRYNFRYNGKGEFELIGYDESDNHGPIVKNTISINFLTKKLQHKKNIADYSEEDDYQEKFEESWHSFKMQDKVYLSVIKSIDQLDLAISHLISDLVYEEKNNVEFIF